MAQNQIKDIDGVQLFSSFTPNHIESYTVKHNTSRRNPGQNNMVSEQQIKKTIARFIVLLDTLNDKITHSGLDYTTIASALKELTECKKQIIRLDELSLAELGRLYGQLASMSKGKSPTIELLEEYGDSEKVINTIKTKAALMSGIVSQPHRGQ